MMEDMELDEVHVISDLHIGGAEGFQIFASEPELSGLIQHLAEFPGEREVALVINGDFIDFLAEPGATYFDPLGATDKLDRLFRERAFSTVWKALREFVSKPQRILVIVLGNHDLELALPWVRRHLTEFLAQGKDSRRGRIRFVLDGTGFRCKVGDAAVLCLHGNEVDTWNIVDFERLRHAARDYHFALPARRWIPNSGTQLVIDVMNDVKQKYPFVDLLKPETKGVVPILFALDQTKAETLSQIVSVASRLTWDKARRIAGFLSAEEEVAGEMPAPEPLPVERGQGFDSLLGDAFSIPRERLVGTDAADELLSLTEQHLRDGKNPLDLLENQDPEQKLSYFGAALAWLRRKPHLQILLEALEPLKKDKSFDVSHRDKTFELIDKYLGDQFDVVVTGHTHLERAISRVKGRGSYYNSGTWARLIRLSPEVLETPTSFKPVYDAIRAGTMEALDGCPDLVLKKPAVVSVWTERGRVHSALRRVELRNGHLALQEVKGA